MSWGPFIGGFILGALITLGICVRIASKWLGEMLAMVKELQASIEEDSKQRNRAVRLASVGLKAGALF